MTIPRILVSLVLVACIASCSGPTPEVPVPAETADVAPAGNGSAPPAESAPVEQAANGSTETTEETPAPEAKTARVLMVTESKGFRHGSVKREENELAPAEIAMTQLGQQTELFEVHCTQDSAADFTKDNLQNYDIVMFYTTGPLPIAEADQEYFVSDWLRQEGHGFIGFHSATDTYNSGDPSTPEGNEENESYRWYWDMIGGTFNAHPWSSRDLVTFNVHDTSHPGMKAFGAEFEMRDEIYVHRNWQPEKVRVLMSIAMEKSPPEATDRFFRYLEVTGSEQYHVPVAWAKNWGEGKIFVNNLGHNETTWTDQRFLDSTTGAVRWIMNLEGGDATPNPEVSEAENQRAQAALAAEPAEPAESTE